MQLGHEVLRILVDRIDSLYCAIIDEAFDHKLYGLEALLESCCGVPITTMIGTLTAAALGLDFEDLGRAAYTFSFNLLKLLLEISEILLESVLDS